MGVPLAAEGLQEDPACHRRCQVTPGSQNKMQRGLSGWDRLLGFSESKGEFLHLDPKQPAGMCGTVQCRRGVFGWRGCRSQSAH